MSVLNSAPLQRAYLQSHASAAAFATVPNSAGTWTNTLAKLAPHLKCDLKRGFTPIAAEYKTGTGSMLPGIQGRADACKINSLEFPLLPSGVAGTAPNLAPLLANIFGVAGTVVAATSVTYNFADGPGVPLIVALFSESGGSVTSQFAFGGVIGPYSLNIGGACELRVNANGSAYYVLESGYFSSDVAAAQGGLTTFPTEPSSPALAGQMIPAYISTITIGGTSVAAEFLSATISGDTGRKMLFDGGVFGSGIVQGRRMVKLSSLTFHDSDGSALATVKAAAASQSALDVVIAQGGTAGYTVTNTIKAVQFGDFSYSESGGVVNITFDDSPAHASGLSSTNELVIALT